MMNKQTPVVQAAFQWSTSRTQKTREHWVFGAFALLTSLTFIVATPAPVRAALADVLSGFMSGPAEGWHGETVSATLKAAPRAR